MKNSLIAHLLRLLILTVCVRRSVVVLITLFLASPAYAEVYVSDSPPPEALILTKARSMKHCDDDIVGIVGKLPVRNNVWQVYYSREKYWDNEMTLKQLDTNIWILECGDALTGTSWGAIHK